MIENAEDSPNFCKYCGCKFQQNVIEKIIENKELVICEFCGIEINIDRIDTQERFGKDSNEKTSNLKDDIKINKKSVVKKVGKFVRTRKYSVNVIKEDEDFPQIFKENLIIVTSRLIYHFIREWEQENNANIRHARLNQAILTYLASKLKPILVKRIGRAFLENLHNISLKEFNDCLKLLQEKIESNQDYRTHFITFLIWLQRIVFKIISQMWEMTHLPNFQAIILRDLKKFMKQDLVLDEKEVAVNSLKEFGPELNEHQFSYQKKNSKFDPNLIKIVHELARKKKINLKLFSNHLEKLEKSSNKYERTAFMASVRILQDLIKKEEIPIFIRGSYQTSFGKSYLRRGEKGFDHFHSYIEAIYEIKCLFKMGTKTDIYIGHTEKSLRRRFEYHIETALNEYIEKKREPLSLIRKAIIKALEQEVTKDGVKYLGLKYEKFCDISHFIEQYQSLTKKSRFIIRKKLMNSFIGKYFEIKVIEKHYTKKDVSDREKWYKENYPDSKGTVFPYGLNMDSTLESVKKYIALPMYDIVFMLSLGYRVPYISRMIKKLYNIKEASEDNIYARIKQFFKSVENAEDQFLRLVVQSLLENHLNLSGAQIGRIIHRKGGKHFFDSRACPFRRWFGDIKLRELKKVIVRGDFSWKKLNSLLEELRNGYNIKGIHKSQWIDLFIKGASNAELAIIAGYKNADTFRKHFFKLEESRKAFGVSNRKEAVKKYRKLKTIQILKNTTSPSLSVFENIYVDVFGFQSRQVYIKKYEKHYNSGVYFFERALKQYFIALFDGMTLKEIIDKYKT